MKRTISKRSIVVDGRKTSVSLENGFWTALKEIATASAKDLPELVQLINDERQNDGSLSSAIRVFVLDHFRAELASRHNQSVRRDFALPEVSVLELATKRFAIAKNIDGFRRLLANASDDHQRKTIANLIAAEESKLKSLLSARKGRRI